MKKSVFALVLGVLCFAAASAPVVVTPGSNAGYLWFPKGSSGGPYSGDPSSGKAGVTIDGMQLARTACYTTSGSVVLPMGFTAGYIQAIVVGGGQGAGGWGGSQPAGQSTSITHADIGTVTAQGGANGVAGSRGGSNGGVWNGSTYIDGGYGGGGGGYLGKGGDGTSSPNYPAPGGSGGGSRGAGGQGFGYGEPGGGSGGPAASNGPNGQSSPAGANAAAGMQPDAPAVIMCPNVPTASKGGYGGAPGGTGFGAGAGGGSYASGGNSGQIATVVWKYTGGPITVVVGAGGSGGAQGVVALRFIPQ